MSKKPKRIRAEVNRGITPDRDMYVLWRGDIRALAGQMVRDIDEVFNRFEGREAAVLEALKRAGMTPGKEAK